MATSRLADALENMAEVAGKGPEAAKIVARALRMGIGNAFWGEALLAAADRIEAKAAAQGTQETWNGGGASTDASIPQIVDVPGAELLEKAKTVYIAYNFPDLATAYARGRECGTEWDEQKRKSHEGYAKRCKARGYVPCEPRALKAPDEQRWAVNHLRHKCSNYEEIYKQLQNEVWDLPIAGWYALYELIHQIVKNRVQDKIAGQFPELAEAAEEQKV